MIVSINQPAYLPWLGYFHRVAISDLHITLDHVQFEKNGFINRNRIRTANSWCWLTVPVRTKGHFRELSIQQLKVISDQRWRSKHWKTIQQAYRRAPFYADYANEIKQLYSREWANLADLLEASTCWQCNAFRIATPLVKSSEVNVSGTKQDLVLILCRAVGATTYISGPFGRDYLNLEDFRRANIDVLFHDYKHPVYPQVYTSFEPCMAALDVLLNVGPEALNVIRSGNEEIEEEVGCRRAK